MSYILEKSIDGIPVMDLWIHWYGAIRQLRHGFSRELTFLWFALSVAGLGVHTDKLGISSIVRALALEPERSTSDR